MFLLFDISFFCLVILFFFFFSIFKCDFPQQGEYNLQHLNHSFLFKDQKQLLFFVDISK